MQGMAGPALGVFSADHELQRQLRGLCAEWVPPAQLVVFGDPETLRAALPGAQFTLLFVDQLLWRMLPSAQRHFLAAPLAPHGLLVCDALDPDVVIEALEAGLHGAVLRTSTPEHWHKAMNTVLSGELWLPRDLMGRCLRRLLRGSVPDLPADVLAGGEPLTERERDILDCATQGLTNKQIARNLGISPATVKTHMHHIFAKLQVTRRVMLRGGSGAHSGGMTTSLHGL